jgi:hypothetical protein
MGGDAEIEDEEIEEPSTGDALDAEVEADDIFDAKKIKDATGIELPPGAPGLKKSGRDIKIKDWDVDSEEGKMEADSLDDLEVGSIDGLMDEGMDPYGIEIDQPPDTATLVLPPANVFEADFEQLPEIDEVFVMTRGGILLKHFTYKDTSVADEDLLTSMLAVIQNFVKDSFGKKKTALNMLELGEFNILIMQGENLGVVAITQEEDVKPLKDSLKKMVKDIETQNKDVLEDWDGDQDAIQALDESVDKLVRGEY